MKSVFQYIPLGLLFSLLIGLLSSCEEKSADYGIAPSTLVFESTSENILFTEENPEESITVTTLLSLKNQQNTISDIALDVELSNLLDTDVTVSPTVVS
ncbi:hypothetical protein [Sediminitomix flava]|uniref:Uncharacterized protein n=1 Tax=Sediminitomix flava TaxID=379075 RepID=A0A315ZCW4_SEDFL|nr:hypothetical protein [Sediminitomix flava]PWJ43122.1 hypothetical protein BC781_102671 [Sediminitomix flava]